MTEVWFRNPRRYIDACAEMLAPNILWDNHMAAWSGIDPQRQIELFYPRSFEYRLLVVGDYEANEYRRGSREPFATYPCWTWDEDEIVDLGKLLETTPERVVIRKLPHAHETVGMGFAHWLALAQADYPDTIIHPSGYASYRLAFGMGYGAADVDPDAASRKMVVMLPNGKRGLPRELDQWQAWVRMLGFRISDLSLGENRCRYNIKSAMWAGENWDKRIKFKTQGRIKVDIDAAIPQLPEANHVHAGAVVQPGDKIACNYCSLAPKCKYFRDGGVCVIPDTETAGLAAAFNTRDSDRIIDGLQKVMVEQATRAQTGIEVENVKGELDPEVTKILDRLFNNGVKLAKLVNPALAAAGASRTMVQINNGQQNDGMTGNALAAAAVAAIEAQGVARSDITIEMITQYLAEQAKPLAIEATVHGDP